MIITIAAIIIGWTLLSFVLAALFCRAVWGESDQ